VRVVALAALTAVVLWAPSSGSAGRSVCRGPGKVIVGTARDDILRGTNGRDTICGLGGNDILIGRGGNDVLVGGQGRDRADYRLGPGPVSVDLLRGWVSGGQQGIDRIFSIEDARGTASDDVLRGNGGPNVLLGGPGLDTMQGDGGDDFLLGGDGDDFLSGWFGRDSLSGGAGTDIVSYTNSLTPIVVSMRSVAGSGDVAGEGRDELAGIETVVGSEFDDVLSAAGPGGAAHFEGGGGDDRLFGSPHNDLLDGGEGYDEGNGGPGDDSCPNVELATDC